MIYYVVFAKVGRLLVTAQFLPRDAYKCSLCCRPMHFRLSVTFVCCMAVVKLPSQPGSPTILVS